MHGLINRSIQCFTRDTYGDQVWEQAVERAQTGHAGFEAMLTYDDDITYQFLDALAAVLNRSRQEVMEDIGTYLVSHEKVGAVRRLLRFSGVTFADFLHSLDELHDRVRMAVPDLHIPQLSLREHASGQFSLRCHWDHPDFGYVVMGLLRGMADDYGALVFMDHQGTQGADELISIEVVEADFAEGRSFMLGNEEEALHG
ncbi:heme NO-binding domain-containing protein [Halocynthiibacter namhaensis]|uniref:heme NO-binding domain-containing protein n=1 Tax=Halocynthiibacter namhaensis TaxID=1290553 RepID=UPI0005794E34|nr:heme NO-binding domain-containing protein [Halocynthiibacter namhaensis]